MRVFRQDLAWLPFLTMRMHNSAKERAAHNIRGAAIASGQQAGIELYDAGRANGPSMGEAGTPA
jgi:predicted secreted Zn-dependent protease